MSIQSHSTTVVDPVCTSPILASIMYGEIEIEDMIRTTLPMLREIIDHVESIEFSVTIGLASGINQYKTNIESCKKVQELKKLCEDRSIAVFILGHMLDLTTRKFDLKYRNPLEHAMFAYLYCITSARTDLNKAAISVSRRMKGCTIIEGYIRTFLV